MDGYTREIEYYTTEWRAHEVVNYLKNMFPNLHFFVRQYNQKPMNKRPSYAYKVMVSTYGLAPEEIRKLIAEAQSIVNDPYFW